MFPSALSRKQIKLLEQLGFLKKYGFYLAGGTALAIQVGHRTSLDFDFYTKKSFDSKKLQHFLEKKFEETILLQKDEDTLIVKINDVAVSFFKYSYPLIFSLVKQGKFPPMASKEDIAAMKIIAISDRGTKRDFVDIYFLLQEFSLKKILNFVKKKYPNFNIYVALRGLTYFVDADKKQTRKLYLFYGVSLKEIKKFLIDEVRKYQQEYL
jgi:hypothetical protein